MDKTLPLRKEWIFLPWQRLPLWIHPTKYQYARQTFQFQIGLWPPIHIFNFLPDLYKVEKPCWTYLYFGLIYKYILVYIYVYLRHIYIK